MYTRNLNNLLSNSNRYTFFFTSSNVNAKRLFYILLKKIKIEMFFFLE